MTVTSVGDSGLQVYWEAPSELLGMTDLYEVKKFMRDNVLNVTMLQTSAHNITFEDLPHNTEYGFQVIDIALVAKA